MIYTIDVEDIIGYIEQFRLQKDNSWKKIRDFMNLSQSDKTFNLPQVSEARNFISTQKTIELDGFEYPVNPHELSFGYSVAFMSLRLHRQERPAHPLREDLQRVIETGSDDRTNKLYLRVDGKFGLMDFRDYQHDDPSIAMVHEAFVEGNGYVGPDAAKAKRFMDQTWIGSLSGWLQHLNTGRLNIFIDWVGNKTESELLEEADSLFP